MMHLQGTVKRGGAYNVKGKDGSEKTLVSFTVADEIGNTYSCQMWPDDQQQADLMQVIGQAQLQPVSCNIVGYRVRMRQIDGKEQPQVNFVVSNVVLPNMNFGVRAA
jgi:hypothetical protein